MITKNTDFFIPKFSERSGRIVADRCIWCGSKAGLSDSHLIAESLGGRLSTDSSCEKCNGYLGYDVEGSATRNAFITTALVKLGLKNRKEAYRHAKKFLGDSDFEAHIVDDTTARTIPKDLGDFKFLGEPKNAKNTFLRKFREVLPNWPTGPLESFFDDPTQKTLRYAGLKFTKKEEKGSGLRIEGLARDPFPPFIFKIAYEFLSLNGFLCHPFVSHVMRSLFIVNKSNHSHTIEFSDEVFQRVISNTALGFPGDNDPECIDYCPYHRVMLRLSNCLVLYVQVILFGVLSSSFIIGKYVSLDSLVAQLLDRPLYIPVREKHYVLEDPYPNVKYKDWTICNDAIVDFRFGQIWGGDKIKAA